MQEERDFQRAEGIRGTPPGPSVPLQADAETPVAAPLRLFRKLPAMSGPFLGLVIVLSVGSVVALVTVVAMQVYNLLEARAGSPLLTSLGAVAAGMSVSVLCGLCNGLGVTRLRLAPFVVTLGMLSIARGLAIWLAGRTRLAFTGERPAWVDVLGVARAKSTLFAPGVWSFLLLAAVVAVLLRFTI